jgi:PLP dependent protein
MQIRNNIANICQILPVGCRLVAVSKFQPPEKVLEAYEGGQRLFGENKVQELVQKYESLPKDIEWHMIGHLQTNKVKYIAPFIGLIESVDSEKLVKEIDKQGARADRRIPCLLQVHIAQEETKFGFSEEELIGLLENDFGQYKHVKVFGLMAMATQTDEADLIMNEFSRLRTMFDQLNSRTLPPNVEMQELSIGMSHDYQLAIAAGSTIIRIGTAIFGERTIAK